jgi:hypothetical protein
MDSVEQPDLSLLPEPIAERFRTSDPARRDEIIRSLQANTLLTADFINRSTPAYRHILLDLDHADWPTIALEARRYSFRLASIGLIASRYAPLLAILDGPAHPQTIWPLFTDLAESWILLLGMTTRLSAPAELAELGQQLMPLDRLDYWLNDDAITAWLTANSGTRAELGELLRIRVAATVDLVDAWAQA